MTAVLFFDRRRVDIDSTATLATALTAAALTAAALTAALSTATLAVDLAVAAVSLFLFDVFDEH